MDLLQEHAEFCVIVHFPRKNVTALTRFSQVEMNPPKVEPMLWKA